MSRVAVPIASVALAACVLFAWTPSALAGAHDALIAKHAAANGVPEPLVRRVIRIESRGRANVVHKGNYGLMQIRLGTARSLGYSGEASGLLDPDTNLTYAVKYLAGAYRAAGCDADRAVSYYKRGYYGVKRADCASRAVEVAKADADAAKPASAKSRSDTTGAPAADMIKPRVVQAELISKSKPEPTPMPRLAKFEPVRVSVLSAAAVAPPVPFPRPKPAALAATPAPAPSPAVAALDAPAVDAVPLPSPKPSSLTEQPEPTAGPAVAMLEAAATDVVPLPRVRPEPKPDEPHAHRAEHKHRAESKHRAETRHAHAGKKTEDKKASDDSDVSGTVISFLKKITTPEKKARKQAAQESLQAQSPSQNF